MLPQNCTDTAACGMLCAWSSILGFSWCCCARATSSPSPGPAGCRYTLWAPGVLQLLLSELAKPGITPKPPGDPPRATAPVRGSRKQGELPGGAACPGDPRNLIGAQAEAAAHGCAQSPGPGTGERTHLSSPMPCLMGTSGKGKSSPLVSGSPLPTLLAAQQCLGTCLAAGRGRARICSMGHGEGSSHRGAPVHQHREACHAGGCCAASHLLCVALF